MAKRTAPPQGDPTADDKSPALFEALKLHVGRYESVPVGVPQPHPANARKGSVTLLAQSMKAVGFYGDVILQEKSDDGNTTGFIIVGEHRWKAWKKIGGDLIPVKWLDVNDAQAQAIRVIDNGTSDAAGYDYRKLSAALDDVTENNGSLTGTGFSDNDAALLKRALNKKKGPINFFDFDAERNAEAKEAAAADTTTPPDTSGANGTGDGASSSSTTPAPLPPGSGSLGGGSLDALRGAANRGGFGDDDENRMPGAAREASSVTNPAPTTNPPTSGGTILTRRPSVPFPVSPLDVWDSQSQAWGLRCFAWNTIGVGDTVKDAKAFPDAALCEVLLQWFTPGSGHVLDAFALTDTMQKVAGFCGFRATAGPEVAAALTVEPTPESDPAAWYDFVLCAPPATVWKDAPGDAEDRIGDAAQWLNENRFLACIVPPEEAGAIIGVLRGRGLNYHTNAALLTRSQDKTAKVERDFQKGRRLGRAIFSVLLFYKGDADRIKEHYSPEVEYDPLDDEASSATASSDDGNGSGT